MWPGNLERVQKYNRVSHEQYISWLLARIDLPMRPVFLTTRTREDVDEIVLSSIEKKPTQTPSWVEAAQKSLEEEVEEVEEVEDGITLRSEEPSQPEVAPQDNPFSAPDYDSWTVVELREECKNRGITVRGTKAEVVLRLRRDDEGLTQDPVEPDEDESEAPVEETAADDSSDAPSEEEAATEEVTPDADSGETSNIEEEE